MKKNWLKKSLAILAILGLLLIAILPSLPVSAVEVSLEGYDEESAEPVPELLVDGVSLTSDEFGNYTLSTR